MSDIVFGSVKDAVRWSEEVATIPDVRSCLGSMISKPSASRLTRQDVIEIALTISHITAQAKPFMGMTMKTIYGRRNEAFEHALALRISSLLRVMDAGKEKDTHQLVAVGLGTIRHIREAELYGGRFPVRVQAKLVGVSRERYSTAKSWCELRLEAARIVREWLKQADKAIYPELKSRGWIG